MWKGVWLFEAKQEVKLNCFRNENPCFGNDYLPISINSTCQQQYIKIRLITVSGEELMKDTFKVPSGCSCAYGQENLYY